MEGGGGRLELARSTFLPGEQQSHLKETFSGERKLGSMAGKWPDPNWGPQEACAGGTAPHRSAVSTMPKARVTSFLSDRQEYSPLHSFHLSFSEG